MWECLHCGESVEEVFAVCWKCQANRDGTPSELQDPPRDEQEEDEIILLGRRGAATDCLRCGGPMRYAGTREFQEGTNWGVWGVWGEMFGARVNLEMYVCPACLHVEFFAVPGSPET